MSQDEYITARIPRAFDEPIKKYLEKNKEMMTLSGERRSRAAVIKKALLLFLSQEGCI